MRRFAKFFLLTVVISMLAPGVLAQPQGSSISPPDTSNLEKEVLPRVVRSCNDFGFKLFRAVATQKGLRDNVLVSPLSAYIALAMAYNGAAGATRDSIAKALAVEGVGDSLLNETIRCQILELIQADTAIIIDIANSLWHHKTTRIKREFAGLCQAYFSADIRRTDFHNQAAVDSINGWVIVKTRDHIESIVDRQTLENSIALLLSALYFRGDWTFPFDSARTRKEKFHVSGDSAIDCLMMFMHRDTDVDARLFRETDARRPLTYFESKLFQGVNLRYGSRGLLMTVLLPDSLSSIEALVAQLAEDNWRAWQQIPAGGSFYLRLPKFRFECETPLKQILDSLGMGNMFAKNADFSNMFADSVGKVSDVRQKTYIEVNERGTKAAAVTRVLYPDSMPPSLIANRPFLFLIHDKETGLILFIGKVANPKW
jgi:serine protease inhibitor